VNGMLSSTPSSALSIAIENWPGPNNDYIATTPRGWEKLLSLVTNRRFGLEFDPSHLLRVGVDPYGAFEAVKDRVKILHAKDTTIDAKLLQEVGYHGEGWWRYTLPGSGKLDWPKFLRQAQSAGYDDVISIEHEDAEFGWPGKELEARKEGERRALAHLRRALSA
jgi:sugar phosphate isomerase/epimerase